MKKNKLSIKFIVLFILYVFWIKFFTSGGKSFMIWNIFLAFIPYFISCYIYNVHFNNKNSNKKSSKELIMGMIWILFYPNAPYMITDLMHLTGERFYIYINNGRDLIFNMDINMWNNFFTLIVGTVLGLYLGIISLRKIHYILEDKVGRVGAFLWIIVINYLSGFAIFLGRFSRYNSWDLIIHPYKILKIMREELNINAVIFTVLFGTLSFIIYYFYYITSKEEKN